MPYWQSWRNKLRIVHVRDSNGRPVSDVDVRLSRRRYTDSMVRTTFSRRLFCVMLGITLLVFVAYSWLQNNTVASAETALPIDVELHKLRSGDLVFRQSDTLASHYVRTLQADALYSHIGIIVLIDGKPTVIHAMPPDGKYEGRTVQETLNTFLTDVTGFAIYRVTASPAQAEIAAQVAKQFAEDQTPFDIQFDLTTDESLYCTELVWKAWQAAAIDLVDGKFDMIEMPFAKGAYILPNSLTQKSKLNLIVVHPATQ